MTLSVDLNIQKKYHIHRGYLKNVSGPLDYLVRILGLDCEEKKLHKNKCDETLLRYSNKKFAAYLRIYFSKKRKLEMKAKLKSKHYEEVEETV